MLLGYMRVSQSDGSQTTDPQRKAPLSWTPTKLGSYAKDAASPRRPDRDVSPNWDVGPDGDRVLRSDRANRPGRSFRARSTLGDSGARREVAADPGEGAARSNSPTPGQAAHRDSATPISFGYASLGAGWQEQGLRSPRRSGV